MLDPSFGDDLGAVLRARRERLGLKQAELAELAGCSTRFVHSVEAGKATLRLDKLLELMEVLGLGFELRRGAPLSMPSPEQMSGEARP
jgi:HTH-type transcriptional regulator/antitoxin HipB